MPTPSESSLAAVLPCDFQDTVDGDHCFTHHRPPCPGMYRAAVQEYLDAQLAQARAEERETLIVVFAQWLNDVAPLKANGERASGLIERIKALP